MSASETIPFSPEKGKRTTADTPQRDQLIELANDRLALWHTQDGLAVASILDGVTDRGAEAFRGSFAIRSKSCRSWLAWAFYKRTGKSAGGQAVEDALRVLEGQALYASRCHEAFVRVAGFDGAIFVDLGDETHAAVEITADGWRVVQDHGVRFIRPAGLAPFPEPEPEGSLDELRAFLNVSKSDFPLVVGWIVGAFRPDGPYPILVLTGEQGAAKSTAARVLRATVDPNTSPIRTMPRDERDLVIAAKNAHCLCFDNVSDLPPWSSDALCRIASGGGFATRMLHTDHDEVLIDVSRPIILNGITNFTTRPDLVDRAITIHLPSIPGESRRFETEFFRDFEAARPFLLGAVFDAVSGALRCVSEAALGQVPRMADFARWVVSAEAAHAVPWDTGVFMDAYANNRRGATEATVHEDLVANAVVALIDDILGGCRTAPDGSPDGCWQGTASELLETLRERVPDYITKSRAFPSAPNALGNKLKRITPALRSVGVIVEAMKSGSRQWLIRRDG